MVDVIDSFVIVCTVVLLCAWGFMIYTNWKGKDYAIKFPPYGYDICPIGYRKGTTTNKCESKGDLKKYFTNMPENVNINEQTVDPKYSSKQLCAFFNEAKKHEQDSGKIIWDGLPTKKSHPNVEDNTVYKLLNSCCENIDGSDDDTISAQCNSLQFSKILSGTDAVDLLKPLRNK